MFCVFCKRSMLQNHCLQIISQQQLHNVLSRVQKEDRFISYTDNILVLRNWGEQWDISDFLGAANTFVHGRLYHQCQPKEPITTLKIKNHSVHIRSESCWRNTECKNCYIESWFILLQFQENYKNHPLTKLMTLPWFLLALFSLKLW